MPVLEILSLEFDPKWLELGIHVGTPFLVLAILKLGYSLGREKLPKVFYPASVLCAVLGVLYAPGCLCMGAAQLAGTALISLIFSVTFYCLVALISRVYLRKWFKIMLKAFETTRASDTRDIES